jgi:serine protease Do
MGRRAAVFFLLLLAAFCAGIALMFNITRARAPQPPGVATTVQSLTDNPRTPLVVKTDTNPIRDPGAIANAAARVEPSVVTIDTEYRPRIRYGQEDPYGEAQAYQEIPRGTGSGVVLSADGIIVTNNHVVTGATRISVTLSDGREVMGQVLGADPQSDLAVVKVDAKNLTPVTLADSDKVRVGEWAVAVGDPLRVGITVTAGIVSAIRKNEPTGAGTAYATLIQTDAAINPGNSGGALADIEGRLIGINSAIRSNTGGSVGIGYAIPSNTVRDITAQLVQKGRVSRPYLGIAFGALTPMGRQQLNMQNAPDGVFIGRVQSGSPAETAGLQPGDMILSANDTGLKTTADMQAILLAAKVGDTLRLRVWRASAEQTMNATLAESPAPLAR